MTEPSSAGTGHDDMTAAEQQAWHEAQKSKKAASLDGEFTRGVIERCDNCGRMGVMQAVMDPDDPLGWVVEGYQCKPCRDGVEVESES